MNWLPEIEKFCAPGKKPLVLAKMVLLFLLDCSPVISWLRLIAPFLVEKQLPMTEVYSTWRRGHCQEEQGIVTRVTLGTHVDRQRPSTIMYCFYKVRRVRAIIPHDWKPQDMRRASHSTFGSSLAASRMSLSVCGSLCPAIAINSCQIPSKGDMSFPRT